MIIPKTYQQMGRTISVVMEQSSMKDYHGLAIPDQDLIILSSDIGRKKLEHTFLHEALHIALQFMGHNELYQDETFINTLSGLLHQMLTTQKGDSAKDVV